MAVIIKQNVLNKWATKVPGVDTNQQAQNRRLCEHSRPALCAQGCEDPQGGCRQKAERHPSELVLPSDLALKS